MFKIIDSKKHLCKAYRCGNKRTAKDPLCSKHRHRYNKENNPLAYAYNTLKSNARRRGKPFTISREYFETFCKEHDYLARKGKSADSASIDCKIPHLGYVEGNLQVLSLSNNSKKMHADNSPDYCPF